jgi:thiol-disulfide isomerase/thioredoxin
MSPFRKILVLLAVILWQAGFAQPGAVGVLGRGPGFGPGPGKGFRVYVFLSPECPLCQNYTRTLNQLDQQYAGKIAFYGVVPGKTWKTTDLTAFESKYHIVFPLQIDRDLHLSHSLHATTTPEVILIAADNTVYYQGAIDNWYKMLGQPQNHPTQNYLHDAINSVLRHETPLVRKTTPVGCLINDF